MIGKRLTDNFKIVYLYDPALLVFSESEIAEYQNNGCDISRLDLSKCIEKPTVFECKPLEPKYHYLLGQREELRLATAWQIFKSHVVGVQNFATEKGEPLLKWTDGPKPTIEDDCQNNVNTDVLEYVSEIIVAKAGDPANFPTVQVSFWGTMARLRIQHPAKPVVEKSV